LREMSGFLIFLIFIVFVVTWCFIISKENILIFSRIRKFLRKEINEEYFNDEELPIIVAGIIGYESGVKVNKRTIKRIFYKKRREEIPLWRIKGRIR